MPTTKDTPRVQRVSRAARLFIGLMALGGVAVVGSVALGVHAWPHLPFLAMLALAVPASRLKLKLPGLTGNMSVSLPFILLAAVTLSTFEAVVLAMLSAAVQSLPRDGGKIKPMQIIFNLSTMAIAVGLASEILHRGAHLSLWASASKLMVLAGTSLLLAQTVPVATSHTRMKSAASCMSFESALTRESRIQLSCAIRLFQQLGTNVKYCY